MQAEATASSRPMVISRSKAHVLPSSGPLITSRTYMTGPPSREPARRSSPREEGDREQRPTPRDRPRSAARRRVHAGAGAAGRDGRPAHRLRAARRDAHRHRDRRRLGVLLLRLHGRGRVGVGRPVTERRRPPDAPALADGLTLARVTAWPAERGRALLASPDWRALLGAALRDDAEFRAAVLVASHGLRPAVERALRGEPPADREATRLLAYAVRMATRTTPFGLFASVGPVAFGAEERRVEPLAGRTVHANV